MPYEESLRRVASASVLVAARSRSLGAARSAAGWLPAKLFDYLATGLPIVWVGAHAQRRRVAAGRSLGMPHSRDRRSVDGVVTAMREEAGKRYHRDLEGLSRRDRARALADLLDAHPPPRAPRIELP